MRRSNLDHVYNCTGLERPKNKTQNIQFNLNIFKFSAYAEFIDRRLVLVIYFSNELKFFVSKSAKFLACLLRRHVKWLRVPKLNCTENDEIFVPKVTRTEFRLPKIFNMGCLRLECDTCTQIHVSRQYSNSDLIFFTPSTLRSCRRSTVDLKIFHSALIRVY